jgi:hypothetical protein
MIAWHHKESNLVSSIKTSAIGASIGLIGGIWLQVAQDRLIAVVPLLIALPALNAMIGDLSSIITAHISDPDSADGNHKKLYKTLLIVVPFSATGVWLVSMFVAYLQEFDITKEFAVEYGLFIALLFIVSTFATLILSYLKTNTAFIDKTKLAEGLIPLAGVVSSVITLILLTVGLFYIL